MTPAGCVDESDLGLIKGRHNILIQVFVFVLYYEEEKAFKKVEKKNKVTKLLL